jgi:hypothetical protein
MYFLFIFTTSVPLDCHWFATFVRAAGGDYSKIMQQCADSTPGNYFYARLIVSMIPSATTPTTTAAGPTYHIRTATEGKIVPIIRHQIWHHVSLQVRSSTMIFFFPFSRSLTPCQLIWAAQIWPRGQKAKSLLFILFWALMLPVEATYSSDIRDWCGFVVAFLSNGKGATGLISAESVRKKGLFSRCRIKAAVDMEEIWE